MCRFSPSASVGREDEISRESASVRTNEHDNEHLVVLVEGRDEEVVIIAPDNHTCDETMKVKVWRQKVGMLKPVWGAAAPLVDLDEGEIRYMLISCKSIYGGVYSLVRGYNETDSQCRSFGDVLEEAVPPLALAGYSDIKPLGGGASPHARTRRTPSRLRRRRFPLPSHLRRVAGLSPAHRHARGASAAAVL